MRGWVLEGSFHYLPSWSLQHKSGRGDLIFQYLLRMNLSGTCSLLVSLCPCLERPEWMKSAVTAGSGSSRGGNLLTFRSKKHERLAEESLLMCS